MVARPGGERFFRNSRVNGAPLTVFEFEPIVIAYICVGVIAAALMIDLVAGLWQILEDWYVLEDGQILDDSPISQ